MDTTVMMVAMSPFLMVAAIVYFSISGGTKRRAAVLKTVEEAIKAGQQLTPASIRALGAKKDTGSDMKTGAILMAVAAAIVVFGWAMTGMDDDFPQSVFNGIAAFPGFIGLVLLGFGFTAKKETPEQD
jgi:hypothetical protein